MLDKDYKQGDNACKGVRIYNDKVGSKISDVDNYYNGKNRDENAVVFTGTTNLSRREIRPNRIFRTRCIKLYNCKVYLHHDTRKNPNKNKPHIVVYDTGGTLLDNDPALNDNIARGARNPSNWTISRSDHTFRYAGLCDEDFGDHKWNIYGGLVRGNSSLHNCPWQIEIEAMRPNQRWYCVVYAEEYPTDAWLPVGTTIDNLRGSSYTYNQNWEDKIRIIESNCGCTIKLQEHKGLNNNTVEYKFSDKKGRNECNTDTDAPRIVLDYDFLRNILKTGGISYISVTQNQDYFCRNRKNAIKCKGIIGEKRTREQMKQNCTLISSSNAARKYENFKPGGQCDKYAKEDKIFKNEYYDDKILAMCKDPSIKNLKNYKSLCGCLPEGRYMSESYKRISNMMDEIGGTGFPTECVKSCNENTYIPFSLVDKQCKQQNCWQNMEIKAERGANLKSEELAQGCKLSGGTSGGTGGVGGESDESITSNTSFKIFDFSNKKNKVSNILIIIAIICCICYIPGIGLAAYAARKKAM